MHLILILVIVLAAGVGFLVIFARQKAAKRGTKTAEELVGICNIALDRTVRKQANLDKIIALFNKSPASAQGKRELSNAEIRKALGVSSRTAVRYMDRLEKEKKVEQVGIAGHTVTYRLK